MHQKAVLPFSETWTGWKVEPDEVQQGQVQGPAPGEELPHASVEAWGGPAGEQLCGEGPWCPGG